MKADELNLLLAQGRMAAHEQLPGLEEAYLSQFSRAGRRMASRIRDTEPVAVTADASGWEPPTLEELLAAGALAITAVTVLQTRRKAALAAMETVTAAVDEEPEVERVTYVLDKLSSRTDELIGGMRDPINKALIQAQSEGLSVRQTARLIQETVDGIASWQANTLARTDLLAVSNLASDQAVRQLNESFRKAGETAFTVKQWVTAHDDRVRPNHVAVDGARVPIDQPFHVGASTLMFPCDPSASPDETWNCRCVCTYHEQDALIASSFVAVKPDLRWFPADQLKAIESLALGIDMPRAKLFPPPDALPSTETQEDSMSGTAGNVTSPEVEVTLRPQLGIGVFVEGGEFPLAFQPINPITEGDECVGFSWESTGINQYQNGTIPMHAWDFFSGGLPKQTVEDLVAAVTITVNGEEEDAEVVGEPVPWEGVLAVEGVKTGDSSYAPRILLPGSVSHRDLPLSLMAQTVTAEGHQGARLCGKIDEIWRVDRPDLGEGAVAIMGRGTFNATAFGQEIAGYVENKSLRGVSIDLVAAKYQIVTADGLTPVPDDQVDLDVLMNGGYLLGLVEGDIGAATLCAGQALADATIALVASGEQRCSVFSNYGIHLCVENELDVLVASAAPIAPPKEWFFEPEPREVTPMTITKEGRVYGHAATWDCHEGYRDRCMMAPRSKTGLAYFHTGEIETAEGDLVSIGKWTVRGPHAPINLSRSAAQEHYDNCSTVVAFVRAVEGRHGIWVSGCLKSDATPEQIRDARANAPSGDWRAGELILVHSVPVQGLPVLRRTEARVMVASDGQETVALITPPVEDCDCPQEMSIAEYEIRIEALAQIAGIEAA